MVNPGVAVQAVREARGYDTQSVCTRAEITADELALIEAGRYAPSLDVLRRLARALDVEPEALVLFAADMADVAADDDVADAATELERLCQTRRRLEAALARRRVHP